MNETLCASTEMRFRKELDKCQKQWTDVFWLRPPMIMFYGSTFH